MWYLSCCSKAGSSKAGSSKEPAKNEGQNELVKEYESVGFSKQLQRDQLATIRRIAENRKEKPSDTSTRMLDDIKTKYEPMLGFEPRIQQLTAEADAAKARVEAENRNAEQLREGNEQLRKDKDQLEKWKKEAAGYFSKPEGHFATLYLASKGKKVGQKALGDAMGAVVTLGIVKADPRTTLYRS